MREWRRNYGRQLPCEGCCNMRVVQHGMDDQSNWNSMYSYVFTLAHLLRKNEFQNCLCACVWCPLANACTCEHGVAGSGAVCTKDRDAKCAFCNNGWTIDYSRTKCIRTCAHSHVHQLHVHVLTVCALLWVRFRSKCMHMQEWVWPIWRQLSFQRCCEMRFM